MIVIHPIIFFIMTANIKLLQSESNYYLFNIDNFGLFDVNKYLYDVISHFIENGNLNETCGLFNTEERELIAVLDKVGYSNSCNSIKNSSKCIIHKAIDRITLHVSNDCNLRCKYCYASGGAYGKSRELMSLQTAERFVDYCCNNIDVVHNIVFFGGEPFLNYPVVEYVCEYFHKKFDCGAIQSLPKFGAITNGTIISPMVFSIIEKYFSFLTVSIDGPREINDKNRVTPSGNGSFVNIHKFLTTVKSMPKLKIGIEATYTEQHIESGYTRDDIKEYFKREYDIKADIVDEMSFDSKNTAITGLEKPLESPWFNSILKTIVRKEHETKCPVMRKMFAVSTDGSIYPCHMNVGDGMAPVATIWGNNNRLEDIVNIDNSYDLKDNEICNQCWVKNICGGCSRKSFYNPVTKRYSNHPIKDRCDDFKNIVEKVLIKICEVRKDPILWKTLLIRVNKQSN